MLVRTAPSRSRKLDSAGSLGECCRPTLSTTFRSNQLTETYTLGWVIDVLIGLPGNYIALFRMIFGI